jgi:glycosyltransferase involved in cell wall biosynthesis
MKVLFIQNSMDSGGVSKVNSILAKEFIKQGHEVEFLSFQKATNTNFKVHSFNFKKYKVIELFITFFKMLSFFRQNHFDLIISSSDLISLPVSLANRFFSYTLIVNSHTNVIEHLKTSSVFKKLLYHFCGFAHKYSTVVANVSSGAVLASRQFYNNNSIVELPNPVEYWTGEYGELFDHSWFERYRVIVACGRLTASKNYNLMILAINRLVTKYENIRLVILGDGELLQELESTVKEMKLERYICFKGKVSNPVEYMSKSEFLLHTSFYEGAPAVLLEAMSAGIPAVTTNFKSGAYEILGDNEYGIISNSFEVDDLVEAIESMLNTEKKDKNFYKSNAERFSPAICCANYLESVGL